MQVHPGIRIHQIPVEGAGGFIVAAGVAALVLVAVPAVWPLALTAVVGGLVAAPLLHRYYY